MAAALLLLVAGCGSPAPAPEPESADLILLNATVYTLDPQYPWATAVAIRDGRIVAVGSDADVSADFAGPTRDLNGMMVLPGFHDAHTHPIYGGVLLNQCDLSPLTSVDAMLERVRECDQALPAEQWLIGGGWNLALFPAANPGKDLLDAVSTERKIFLRAADGHSAWVNSAALAAAGISADTADPPGGVIERDATGEPAGTLRETAMALMAAVLPETTAEERLEGALRGLRMANAYGITALIDAAVGAEELATWRALEADGRLTARVVTSISTEGSLIGSADPSLLDPAARDSGALVRAHAAKIFLDGVLEGETAALLEPYLGRDGAAGTLMMPWEQLRDLVVELDARDVQIHMHAIGDRAVREGLDAIAAAREANGVRDNRHHISHLQLVHPDDHGRFRQLGVYANFQALWAYPDEYITDVNLPAVGQERVDRMYPIASIHRQGGTIVGGSDWSVSSMNPLMAIETAVTRQDPAGAGADDAILNEEERVLLPVMLAAYTRNGAALMHQEDQTGSIERGKLADLVVLERNLFEVDPREIGEVAVVMTLFEGRVVYERPAGGSGE